MAHHEALGYLVGRTASSRGRQDTTQAPRGPAGAARRGLTLVERNAARVEALLVGAAVDVTPHVAEVGDEFQSSEPSEEVPNPNDEHPEEER